MNQEEKDYQEFIAIMNSPSIWEQLQKEAKEWKDLSEAQKVAIWIEERAEHKGWENAECDAEYKFGKELTDEAMKVIDNKII